MGFADLFGLPPGADCRKAITPTFFHDNQSKDKTENIQTAFPAQSTTGWTRLLFDHMHESSSTFKLTFPIFPYHCHFAPEHDRKNQSHFILVRRPREKIMTDPEKTSELMPEQKAKPIHQPGQSPERDAWFTAFFIENHLDYFTFPDEVCSPEQVRFMVYTEGEERYYPCSDRMFDAIMNRTHTAFLQGKYRNVLLRVLALVDDQIEDGFENQYLKSLLEVKFRHETRDEIMIPSRLEKRLLNIFLRRTQIEDPFGFEKTRRNSRTDAALKSAAFRQAINHLDPKEIGRASCRERV